MKKPHRFVAVGLWSKLKAAVKTCESYHAKLFTQSVFSQNSFRTTTRNSVLAVSHPRRVFHRGNDRCTVGEFAFVARGSNYHQLPSDTTAATAWWKCRAGRRADERTSASRKACSHGSGGETAGQLSGCLPRDASRGHTGNHTDTSSTADSTTPDVFRGRLQANKAWTSG
jgi:hypothetical protein